MKLDNKKDCKSLKKMEHTTEKNITNYSTDNSKPLIEVTKTDMGKISELFFMRLYSIEKLEEYFKGKYTYRQLRDCTNKIIMGGEI